MAHKTASKVDYSGLPVTSRKYAQTHGLAQYFTGKPCRNGHLAPRGVDDKGCVICAAARCLTYQKRQYLLNGDHYRARRRELRIENLPAYFFRQSRSRAARKGVPFSITVEDVVIKENCDCCGVRMQVRQEMKHGPAENSPTLDRIRPELGYVKGNLASLCWRCNRLKNDAKPAELRKIANWIDTVSGTSYTNDTNVVPIGAKNVA